MVLSLVDLGNIYRVIFYKVSSGCYFIVLIYIYFSTNLVTALSSFFNLSFFNYLAFSILALSLYINFFSKVLYFYYCILLKNFNYPFLAYYLVILLLNTI